MRLLSFTSRTPNRKNEVRGTAERERRTAVCTFDENNEGILNIVEDPSVITLFGKMKAQLGLKTDVLVEVYSRVASEIYPNVGEPLSPRSILGRCSIIQTYGSRLPSNRPIFISRRTADIT